LWNFGIFRDTKFREISRNKKKLFREIRNKYFAKFRRPPYTVHLLICMNTQHIISPKCITLQYTVPLKDLPFTDLVYFVNKLCASFYTAQILLYNINNCNNWLCIPYSVRYNINYPGSVWYSIIQFYKQTILWNCWGDPSFFQD
jgi:hypothetical protein